MYKSVVSLACLLGAVSCSYYPGAWRNAPPGPAPSCVLGDQLQYLPMFVVPETKLTVLQDYRTIYYTTAPTLVSIGQEDPVPAVRVVLANPIPVTSWKTFIEFPTTFTIVQDGYRLPFPVSALYAPLSEQEILRRPFVDIVYAVPANPAQTFKPANAPIPTAQPAYVSSSRPTYVTSPSATYVSAPRPTSAPIVQKPLPHPARQNVTILHFPEALAQPDVIYQEISDDELGGRNPPLPVIPAGIVQSAAPTPGVAIFVNSKESPVLQLLRDEANRARQKSYLAARNYY